MKKQEKNQNQTKSRIELDYTPIISPFCKMIGYLESGLHPIQSRWVQCTDPGLQEFYGVLQQTYTNTQSDPGFQWMHIHIHSLKHQRSVKWNYVHPL